MAFTRGRCNNFDYCSLADSRRDIEVRVGDDFVCPECGKPLRAPPVKTTGGGALVPVLLGTGVLVLVGGAVFLGMRMGATGPTPHPAEAPQPQAAQGPAAPTDNILFRIAGSNDLALSVAPRLAAAYLAQSGDTNVKLEPAAGESKVVGQRGDRREAISIAATGTAAGLKALSAHTADVVLAERRITPAEHDALAGGGDLSAASAEHVLALDGLAVVVNPANPVPSLRRDQITGIFTGAITDWGAVGGRPGPITLYVPAAQSEQAVTFSALALGGGAMAPSAKHVADAHAVSLAVSADPQAAGVVDLPDILQTKALPIADTGANPEAPTDHEAIAHEDYPLAYRLYLYTAPQGDGLGQRFADYALSPAGQAAVEQMGLVSQTLKPAAPAAAPPTPAPAQPETAAGSYKQFVAGAKKIAITFHFQPNSTELDLKGTRDLDRLGNYLLSNHYSADQMILIGFADNQGDAAKNIEVSQKRADAVAALFTARGMKPGKVGGFGAQLEIADNATEEGREKNRRVEVYIKQ